MKNASDEVIYVGKAKNLKHRIRSYFQENNTPKTQKLVSNITQFEYIVTPSSLEALILESNLIKRYRPKYNVLLKDDKAYPYIKLTKEKHPRLEIVRKITKDGGLYFGPFPHAKEANKTKRLLDRLFPLRKCKTIPKTACLYYHMDQCMAPCIQETRTEEVQKISAQVAKLLSGDYKDIIRELEAKMVIAADRLNFEKAAELRDLIQSVKTTLKKPSIFSTKYTDMDIFGYTASDVMISVQVLIVRQGKMIGRESEIFQYFQDSKEDLLTYITQFYNYHKVPKEILVPEGIDTQLLEQLLDTKISAPKRGSKASLVKMAIENAEISLENNSQSQIDFAVQSLADALDIENISRIEAYDNSNIQGSDPVSVMVVFEDGKPNKKEYRKFILRDLDNKPNDFEAMQEVIRRRYRKVLLENLPPADLILVDGGKPQISAAREVLEDELGLYIPIAGMVKDTKHKTGKLIFGNPPVEISLSKSAFHMIERMQMEVHRFAIEFHRKRRQTTMFASPLDDIPGVGKKRKQQLFKHFGSLENMKAASIEEFKKAGIHGKLAEKVLEKLNQ